MEIRAAEFVVSDASLPPVSSTAWSPIQLPYAPRGETFARLPQVIWIRFRLKRPGIPDDLALYVFRHNVSLEIFMNADRLGGMRPDTSPPPVGWNYPTLVHIPLSAWRDDTYFYIRLQGGVFGAMMSPVLFGSAAAIEALYNNRYFWQIETSKWTCGLGLILGTFTLWLWSRRRQDQMYGLFAASCFSWSVVTLYMFLPILPVRLDLWLGIVHTAGSWSSFFLVSFLTRAGGFNLPRMERSLLVITCIATLLHFVYPQDYFFAIAYGFHGIGILYLLYMCLLCVADAIRRPGGTTTWFSFAFAAMVGLMAHDWYYFIVSPSEDYIHASHRMQLSIPAMLVILFAHLINRFVSALNEYERLNRDLESRVEDHKAALDMSFKQNRLMEIQQGAAIEREKIYRDLHDDVGSKLVSIIHGATSDKDIALARSALESLRQAIYRATYQDQDFDQFMADVREEMEIRASTAGIDLAWHESGQLDQITLSSDQCYHLRRICRELQTNILHHSRARCIAVDVSYCAGRIRLMIEDNGQGFEVGDYSGNGIKNVSYRTTQIGGQAKWHSHKGGTQVTLEFQHPAAVT